MTELPIHGYQPRDRLAARDGGRCEWAVAAKGGTDYFLKRLTDISFPNLGGEKTRARFAKMEREYRAVATKRYAAIKAAHRRSPRLCEHIEFFIDNGSVYIVSRFHKRRDVSSHNVADIPFRQRLRLATQMAEALSAMHAEGLVHGDIKFENILVVDSRTKGQLDAVIIDYDDSYFADSPPASNSIVIDFKYVAPEVRAYMSSNGKDKRLGKKSDIFSLGLVYVHLFSGGGFIELDGPHKTAADRALAKKPLVWPRKKVEISAIVRLIDSCLEPEPSKRPGSEAITRDLKAAETAYLNLQRAELLKVAPKFDPKLLGPRITATRTKKPVHIDGTAKKPEYPLWTPPIRTIDVPEVKRKRAEETRSLSEIEAAQRTRKNVDELRPKVTTDYPKWEPPGKRSKKSP